MSRLCLNTSNETTEMSTEMTIATTKPTGLFSIPLMRFMPNMEVTNVGIIMRIVTDVSVRITVFILLLMILW